jgi:hypothetical protein
MTYNSNTYVQLTSYMELPVLSGKKLFNSVSYFNLLAQQPHMTIKSQHKKNK